MLVFYTFPHKQLFWGKVGGENSPHMKLFKEIYYQNRQAKREVILSAKKFSTGYPCLSSAISTLSTD